MGTAGSRSLSGRCCNCDALQKVGTNQKLDRNTLERSCMIRGHFEREIMAMVLIFAAGVATFVVLPSGWLISACVAVFATYVGFETILPMKDDDDS